jgi:hypothetical protein
LVLPLVFFIWPTREMFSAFKGNSNGAITQ